MWLIAGWRTSWLSPSCQARKTSGERASGTALLPSHAPTSALLGFSLKWASPGGTEVTACMLVVAWVVSGSLRPHGLQPARLVCPWDSLGKNTAVGCHALLQGIFPTQGSNPHLLCLLRIEPTSLMSLALAGGFLPRVPPGKQRGTRWLPDLTQRREATSHVLVLPKVRRLFLAWFGSHACRGNRQPRVGEGGEGVRGGLRLDEVDRAGLVWGSGFPMGKNSS